MIEMIEDMPNEEYHELPEVSRSQAVVYLDPDRGEEYYRGRFIDRSIKEPEQSQPMRFGDRVDAFLTLQKVPDVRLPDGWVTIPDDVLDNGYRRGTRWTKFKAEHAGETLKTTKESREELEKQQAEVDQLMAIGLQVNSHAIAGRLVADKFRRCQLSFVHSDGWRCRPDIVVPGVAVVDIKTARSVGRRAIERSILEYGYDMQGALCTSAWHEATTELLPFVLVCIRNSPPWNVEVYELAADWLKHGTERFKKALDGIEACRWRSGSHGDYTTLHLPNYLKG